MTLDDVAAAAQGAVTLRIASPVAERLRAARAVVERHAAGSAPVYGLNTGLGGNLAHRLAADEIARFQEQLVRGRCVGMGPPLPETVSRAALFCRIIGLSHGGSGLSPAVLDHLVAMFDAGLVPVIPGRGSIGAGDLGLCAHLAAAALGFGEVWQGGARRPAGEALAAARLAPPNLAAKDGLALINASAVTCGWAALALVAALETLLLGAATASLSAEGYRANPAIFDPDIAAARPAGGQVAAAALFRALLEGSSLHEPGVARAIQDALSFRTLAPVLGAHLTALQAAVRTVEIDINSAADNPLVLAERDEILSTPNFHTVEMAIALDALAIAQAHLAILAVQRIIRLMDPAMSQLPRYLSPVGGASNGFVALQKSAVALQAEIKLKATPASLDSVAVSDGAEDHAPQTLLSVRKLDEQNTALRMLIAIEAMVAAQAVDLRPLPKLGRGSRTVYEAVRSAVPVLSEDRETGPDAMRTLDALSRSEVTDALGELADSLELLEGRL